MQRVATNYQHFTTDVSSCLCYCQPLFECFGERINRVKRNWYFASERAELRDVAMKAVVGEDRQANDL